MIAGHSMILKTSGG